MTRHTRTSLMRVAVAVGLVGGTGCGRPTTDPNFPDALKALAGGTSDTIDCRDMTGVGDAQMKELAKAPQLGNLRSLILDNAQVTDEGLRAIPHLPALTTFAASKTRLTDSGLAHLKSIGNIEALRLDKVRVTDQGLAALTELKSIRNLSLWGCAITDAGLAHVAKLPLLEVLSLDETFVTGAGVRKHLTGLIRLRSLSVWKTRVGESDVDELRRTNPELKVNR